MTRFAKTWFALLSLLIAITVCTGCDGQKTEEENSDSKLENKGVDGKDNGTIKFLTSLDYSPFSYIHKGEPAGFDIDLAKEIASKMGKEAIFIDADFSTLLPILGSGKADAAIAMIEITEKRAEKVSFTIPYYKAGLVVMSKSRAPFSNMEQFNEQNGKITYQSGSTMEVIAKDMFPEENRRMSFPKANQAIDAVIAGHADAVLMDEIQANYFMNMRCDESKEWRSFSIANADTTGGSGIAVSKDSHLKKEFDEVLHKLHADGFISNLKKKWLYSKCKDSSDDGVASRGLCEFDKQQEEEKAASETALVDEKKDI